MITFQKLIIDYISWFTIYKPYLCPYYPVNDMTISTLDRLQKEYVHDLFEVSPLGGAAKYSQKYLKSRCQLLYGHQLFNRKIEWFYNI